MALDTTKIPERAAARLCIVETLLDVALRLHLDVKPEFLAQLLFLAAAAEQGTDG
jgi:hypothetical protein